MVEEPHTKCPARHCSPQIPDEEWKCPKCGSGPEAFYIDGVDDKATWDCQLLHDKDEVICSECNSCFSGRRVTSMYVANKNLVKCEHCKGTGWVTRES